MITLALMGILIGMVIGLRYRVMALLPIELCGVLCLLVALFLTSPGAAALNFVIWSCALQGGYLSTALLGRRQTAPSGSLVNQH